MRKYISIVALVACFGMLLYVNLFPPEPPGHCLWYRLLVGLALLPLLAGPSQFRLAGFVTLVLAVILLVGDIRSGKLYEQKRQERLQRIMSDQEWNR